MARYRWTGPHPHRDRRGGRVIEPGDTFDVERIAAAHPDNVERVAEDGADGENATDGDDGDVDASGDETDAPLDPTDHTVAELRDALGEAPFDGDALDAIAAAERDRAEGPRSTALEAIDDAR